MIKFQNYRIAFATVNARMASKIWINMNPAFSSPLLPRNSRYLASMFRGFVPLSFLFVIAILAVVAPNPRSLLAKGKICGSRLRLTARWTRFMYHGLMISWFDLTIKSNLAYPHRFELWSSDLTGRRITIMLKVNKLLLALFVWLSCLAQGDSNGLLLRLASRLLCLDVLWNNLLTRSSS